MVTQSSKEKRLLLTGVVFALLAVPAAFAQQTGDQPAKAPPASRFFI